MDELRQGCAICWLMSKVEDGAEEDAFIGHQTMVCKGEEAVSGAVVDKFRRLVKGWKESHSCFRCWVSQRYCATGESVENRCQWPNIVIPLVRTALLVEKGQQIVQEVGFVLKVGEEETWVASEEDYGRWLGARHKERVWGEIFSNAMVVAIRILLEFGGYRFEERKRPVDR
jgi:hypothetical protein